MNEEVLVEFSTEPMEMTQSETRHNLEKLSKEELIEQCLYVFSLAKKSKKKKDDAAMEKTQLEEERRKLANQIFDLRLENDVLKERIEREQESRIDEDLLVIPLMRPDDMEGDRRVGCLWRFSRYFKRTK